MLGSPSTGRVFKVDTKAWARPLDADEIDGAGPRYGRRDESGLDRVVTSTNQAFEKLKARWNELVQGAEDCSQTGSASGDNTKKKKKERVLDQDEDGNLFVSAEQLLKSLSVGGDTVYEFDITHCTIQELSFDCMMSEFQQSMAAGFNDQAFMRTFQHARGRGGRGAEPIDLTEEVGGSYDHGWLKDKIAEVKAKRAEEDRREEQKRASERASGDRRGADSCSAATKGPGRGGRVVRDDGNEGGRIVEAEYEEKGRY